MIIDATGKKDAKSRCSRLKKTFEDPLTPIHLTFFSSALNIFTTYNKFLQRSDPLSYKVYPVTKDLVRRLAMRILTPQAITNGVTLETLQDSTCYLPLEKVFCGFSTKMLMDKMLREGDITQVQYDTCLRGAQAFYKGSLEYVLTKMDVSDSLWAHACWIDIFNRENASWSDVEYFVNNFSSILQFDDHDTNLLYGQFVDFQTLSVEELPKEALTDAIIKEFENDDGEAEKEYRMDVLWYHLQSMKSPIGNNKRFHMLFEVARIVLLIPHSNAAIERLFSLVNKNKNDSSDRNRLDQDATLSSILAVKLDRPDSDSALCYEFQPDKELLNMAHKSTVTYNKEHLNL